MAVTFSTPVEGASAVAALSTGTLVAQVSDGEGRARSFIPPVAPAGGTQASAVYPSISSVKALTIADVVNGSPVTQYGPVTLVLKPASGDTANVSMPGLYFTLDQDVAVTTVSGTY
jgi:hypothetical protein